MRFRRWPRPTPFEDTSRKRAALMRRQSLEREALPLLADQIAETQRSPDEEMARRAVGWDRYQEASRDGRAERWRAARARLFALPEALRRRVHDLWRSCPYPADPSYFGDLLHQIDVGKLDPFRPPWRSHSAIQPKTTPNPSAFDEAFRQIGARKVGGGQKTRPADEMIVRGNLGSGFLILVSRVRLIDPNESVYTSSNHRLRDSHVGSGGHWIDLEVRGDCSDAEIALIQALAQAADARPALARRHTR